MTQYGETEKQIQQTIINFLRYKGYYCQRLNAGEIRIEKRMIRMAARGTPDIMAFKPHAMNSSGIVSLLFIEVKRPGKSATPAQELMMQELTRYGAKCFVAHSLDEVQKLL